MAVWPTFWRSPQLLEISGTVTLTTAEVADLKAGKCYLSVISAKSPRLGARADIVFS